MQAMIPTQIAATAAPASVAASCQRANMRFCRLQLLVQKALGLGEFPELLGLDGRVLSRGGENALVVHGVELGCYFGAELNGFDAVLLHPFFVIDRDAV